MKKKRNILLILGILIAAGVAILLAQKLYLLKDEQITPTAPGKAEAEDTAAPQCKLTFVVVAPTPTPTATPVPECYSECEFDQDCPESLTCEEVGGALKCVNSECPEQENCTCPEPTPTPGIVACYEECHSDDNCTYGLYCQEVGGVKRCLNPGCPEETNCGCPGPTSTPTSTPTPTNTPVPRFGGGEAPEETVYAPDEPTPTRIELPRAGAVENTVFALLFGAITLGLGLLLAL